VSDLPERQVRLAVRYAEDYPAEIERALEANERLVAEAGGSRRSLPWPRPSC
jgi:hypothetical protein